MTKILPVYVVRPHQRTLFGQVVDPGQDEIHFGIVKEAVRQDSTEANSVDKSILLR